VCVCECVCVSVRVACTCVCVCVCVGGWVGGVNLYVCMWCRCEKKYVSLFLT